MLIKLTAQEFQISVFLAKVSQGKSVRVDPRFPMDPGVGQKLSVRVRHPNGSVQFVDDLQQPVGIRFLAHERDQRYILFTVPKQVVNIAA